MNFEPQLSKKGTPPPQLPITIEVLVVDPALLSAAELQRLRNISSDPAATAATLPPEPFVVTLQGTFRTLGEVRRAIGAARGCDPDIVGLATDDGPLVEEDSLPPVRLALVADSSRQERDRACAEQHLQGLLQGDSDVAEQMELATLAHGFSKLSPEEQRSKMSRPPSFKGVNLLSAQGQRRPSLDEHQRRSSADSKGSDLELNFSDPPLMPPPPLPPPPTTTTLRAQGSSLSSESRSVFARCEEEPTPELELALGAWEEQVRHLRADFASTPASTSA